MTPCSGYHLAVFSEDLAVACYFVATRPPPTLLPCRNAIVVLTTPVKKLSKMVGYSASYSFNSWYMGRV